MFVGTFSARMPLVCNSSLETVQGLLVGTMRYFRASDISGESLLQEQSAAEVNFRPKISHRPD